jgi:hypothetical protein
MIKMPEFGRVGNFPGVLSVTRSVFWTYAPDVVPVSYLFASASLYNFRHGVPGRSTTQQDVITSNDGGRDVGLDPKPEEASPPKSQARP